MKADIGERLISRAAEAAVLGSMILDSACIDIVSDIVVVDDFIFPEHQIIFKAIQKLHGDNGKILDGFLLRDELDTQGQLQKVGGVNYIQEILSTVPSSANSLYYSKVVREKSMRRSLVRAIEKMKMLSESGEPVGEIAYQIQQIAVGLEGVIEPCINSKPILKNLSDIEPLAIHFFWQKRIPSGMLTMLIGDPNLGKSFLTLYMASKVSTGGEWPDADGIPDNRAPKGTVVLLNGEDDLNRVIRPRLDSLGADVSKIVSIEGVRAVDDNGRQYQGFFNLQEDLAALRQTIRNYEDCRLVIIDPLSAFLGRNIDSHRDSDVRSILAPLVEIAEQSGVAIIGVMHLNKSGGGKAIYRGLGSIAFTAASRCVWLVSSDPNNPKSRKRLLTPVKYNVLIEPTGLSFELLDGRVVFDNEPVTITADEALGQKCAVEAPELDKATTWLREILPSGTSLTWKEIVKRGKENNLTESTLRRAKQKVGVKSYQVKIGENRQWLVHIPKDR